MGMAPQGAHRGFHPRALSNTCPHASSCSSGAEPRAGVEQALTRSCQSEISGTRPCMEFRRFGLGGCVFGRSGRLIARDATLEIRLVAIRCPLLNETKVLLPACRFDDNLDRPINRVSRSVTPSRKQPRRKLPMLNVPILLPTQPYTTAGAHGQGMRSGKP
jgi:hypothetical protein